MSQPNGKPIKFGTRVLHAPLRLPALDAAKALDRTMVVEDAGTQEEIVQIYMQVIREFVRDDSRGLFDEAMADRTETGLIEIADLRNAFQTLFESSADDRPLENSVSSSNGQSVPMSVEPSTGTSVPAGPVDSFTGA